MLVVDRTPREDMERAWARHREQQTRGRETPAAEQPPPRPRNLRAILDLGTMTYFTFRGRSYGVPPLPWRLGERILDAWLEVCSHGEQLQKEDLPAYYAALDRMVEAMWEATRPPGRWRRWLKRLGLARNPYRDATEGELAELAVFFLGRRMKSSGQLATGPGATSQDPIS